ncbi:unnamed protein product [Didymodactylos carnosus]|uniref:Uncharacterized protein n=1 Tax=Didymodactylos carnosus TaxID=1234261 RepID=A0A814L7F4_9BILA|nr:unnamed protein product [Didymodactylos carnosus]CAF3829218.1 unnamed protein product [Didymodactylos carnosus]
MGAAFVRATWVIFDSFGMNDMKIGFFLQALQTYTCYILVNLHEPEIDEKSDESNSTTDPTPQALDLSLAVPSSPVLTLTPKSKNRRRARIFSNISSPVSRHSVSEQNEHISEGDESMSHSSHSISGHKHIRAQAEAAYMATIAKRQKLFDKVDRTNVTPKVLPCEIISVQSSSNGMEMYQLCTTKAILDKRFQGLDLLDLTKCDFRDLRDIDSTALPTTTFIQASKDYASAGLMTPVEACNCNGNCATKKCSCRAAKAQCGTKCHPIKKKPCSNA